MNTFLCDISDCPTLKSFYNFKLLHKILCVPSLGLNNINSLFSVKIYWKAMVLDMKDNTRKMCVCFFQSRIMYFTMYYGLCNMNYDFVYIEWSV